MSDRTFVKRRAGAPPGFFAAEAAGLRWLAAAESAGGASVVRVVDVGDESITLAWVESGRPTAVAAENLGRALAATHAVGAPAFGAGPDGWTGDAFIGRQVLPLQPFSSWGSFYAQTRLSPYADAAVRVGNLSRRGRAAVDAVCARLEAGEFDDGRPPARIHGDLWGGNVVYTGDGAVLIDPAAHGGHGQTDLAMLELFGLPHLWRVQDAYAEAAALPADWPSRTGLHQLHPLLVHAVTHGASYGAQAEAISRAMT